MPRRRKNESVNPNDHNNMQENERVIIRPAFGGPLAPKPMVEKLKPAINTKPLRPAAVPPKMQLRPGVQQQLQEQMEKGKVKFKQIEKTLPQRSTPTSTTTTKPNTTSKTSTTSNTTSSQKQSTTSMAKKTDKTTSPAKDRSSGSNYRGTTGPGRDDRLPKDRSTYPAEHIEFNAAETGSGYYQPDPSKEAVPLRIDVPDTTYLDPNETSTVQATDIRHNLIINLSSFWASFNLTEALNPVVESRLVVLYNRMAIDVLNATKGSLSQDFTYVNFKAAILAVMRLLEIYYCLDSIQSIVPTHSDVLETNRTVESYCQYFKTGEAYELRSKMANTIRSTWFPPNFSAMLRWFYQFYKTGNLAQSPAMRYICAEEFLVVNGALKGGSTALPTLVNNACASITTNAKIYAILANVYPTGAINTLPPSAGKLHYDARMEEILVNDGLLHVQKNITYPAGSDRSYYPMAFTLSGNAHNTFTYIMNRDPHLKTNDGLAFVMQALVKTNASTGYPVFSDSQYMGIRRNLMATVDSYAAAQTSNKFTFMSSGLTYPRQEQPNVMVGAPDCHQYFNVNGANIYLSKVNSGFQAVQLNSWVAVRSNLNYLIDRLFNMTPQFRD